MALLAMWHFIKTLGHVVAQGSDLPSLSMSALLEMAFSLSSQSVSQPGHQEMYCF